MQIFGDLYQKDFVLNPKNNGTLKKSNNPSSMKTLPVLATQFLKIIHLPTSKNILFDDSRFNDNI